MEIPRLGVKSELQLSAYAPGTAMQNEATSATYTTSPGEQDPYPLSEARDQICILMDMMYVYNPLSHNGNSSILLYFLQSFIIIIIIISHLIKKLAKYHFNGCIIFYYMTIT